MAKSVIEGDREDRCYICGRMQTEYYHLHVHHIYKAANRKISDQNGFIVHLCPDCHTLKTDSVHGKEGHLKDIYLMKTCQIEYEKKHSRQEFMKLIGCNYLEEDED